MPRLARPDGVELHWEERGDGPLVACAFACLSSPGVFGDLLDLLAADHRVVTYDPRGSGRSARRGPYDRPTDDADLAALLELLGGDAVVLCTGDACNRAVRVAASRPELVRAVVTPAGNPLGRLAAEGSEGLAASDQVIRVLVETMRTDHRAALRMAIATSNPQLDEDGVRERVAEMVAFAPQEVTLARLVSWIGDVSAEEAAALGERLWLIHHPGNAWFPLDVMDRTRELLPEARIEILEDGALSRPDLTAEIVRRATSGAHAAGAGRRERG